MDRCRRAVAALVCTTALAALTSCSDAVSASLHGPLLISEGEWNAGMAMAIGGELARVGDCIGVKDTVVVWPEGVSWDDEEQALVLTDGTHVALGEDVHGGGGSLKTSEVNSLFGSDAAEALRECGVEVGAEVIVFNVGSDVSTEPIT